MKKAAVITMATFYLLLTTGMFVCIVHCIADSMVKKPVMAMDSHAKKHCTSGGDCGCCKKHGEYVIKENLKPTSPKLFAPTAALIARFIPLNFFAPDTHLDSYAWTDVKAPPGLSGKAKSIQLRSLQI